MIKFLLDSGDPEEYRFIFKSAKKAGSELWGSTTNPSLIAKKLTGKKLTIKEAFVLQKDLVMEILGIVPGAVSAEVYADQQTKAEEMVAQGTDIASWHERIYVKLPTTLEGFKARTELRKKGVAINNTLVFSLQQMYAICLHEKIMQEMYPVKNVNKPCFISPFLGRLDDQGQDGLSLLRNGMKLKNTYFAENVLWMLSASIRNVGHMKGTIETDCELITAPASIYTEWFDMSDEQKVHTAYPGNLQKIPYWEPTEVVMQIKTIDDLTQAMEIGTLDIHHPLTDKGIEKFTADWKTILTV